MFHHSSLDLYWERVLELSKHSIKKRRHPFGDVPDRARMPVMSHQPIGFRSLYHAAPTSIPDPCSPSGAVEYRGWPAVYNDGLATIPAQDWSLEVTGCIEKPTRFIYRNILALPQVTHDKRLVSIDGWSYKGRWQGVLLEELVKRIKPEPDKFLYLNQTNALGQVETLSLADALAGQALLCHKVDNHPLDTLYGGPVRLMIFDRMSYKGLRHITALEFSETPLAETSFTAKGYPLEGHIQPGEYYAFDLGAFRPLHGPDGS